MASRKSVRDQMVAGEFQDLEESLGGLKAGDSGLGFDVQDL